VVQAPKNYSLMVRGGEEEEENGSQEAAGTKKRASKKGAGATGSARQQLTGFEGCTHLFSDTDVYPAYQQGRCQAFHSGEQGTHAGCQHTGLWCIYLQDSIAGSLYSSSSMLPASCPGSYLYEEAEYLQCSRHGTASSLSWSHALRNLSQQACCHVCLCAAGKVMVLEALLKSIRAAEPTDKVRSPRMG